MRHLQDLRLQWAGKQANKTRERAEVNTHGRCSAGCGVVPNDVAKTNKEIVFVLVG